MKRIEKNTIFNTAFLIIAFLLFLLYSIPVYSQEDLTSPTSTDDALEEELRYLKAETYVITASRIPENIKKSASSITVITDQQIRQMGARHLADVIQTVPGMNCQYNSFGTFQFGVRGDIRNFQNNILIMVNSHPLNENFSGAATYTHDTMILDNVKKIEVIRGPGSALYGANAFSGVINVITKEAEDVDGWEFSSRGGSYDTQQYNLLYGKTFNELDIAFNYNYFNTHGFNKYVDEDVMSIYLLNRKASLAPGRLKGDDEKYDVALNLAYNDFKFDGRYVDRQRDLPVGAVMALNNRSIDSFKDYYLNISYERTLWEGLDLMGKVYRNHNHSRDDFQYFPPGVVVSTPWVLSIMKDGMINIESLKNNRTGFEIQSTYRMRNSNTVVGGITYEEMKQFDTNRRSNFLYLISPQFPLYLPLPSLRDLSTIQDTNRSVKRNFKAFFIEDIWDITDELRLTVGVRYDDYSDFGSEVSPRAGLTWEFTKGYDLKLLYGHAFRAPSFGELYNILYHTSDLEAETIDTYEISLGAEFTPSFSNRLTLYHNEGDEFIGIIWTPQNYNKMKNQGVEIETRYDFGRGTYLSMNYTYQRWLSPHTRDRNYLSPRHLGNIMANIRLSKYLNLYTSCHIEDGFRRNTDDARDDMSGFAIVNTTLIAKNFLQGYKDLELRGSVYNLFNKDYTYPEDPEIPNDVPQPGRSFMVEVKYKF